VVEFTEAWKIILVTPGEETVSQRDYFPYFPLFQRGAGVDRGDFESPMLCKPLKSPSIPLYEGEVKPGPLGFAPSISLMKLQPSSVLLEGRISQCKVEVSFSFKPRPGTRRHS